MSGKPEDPFFSGAAILFDSWTSQVEIQGAQPPRLGTLFGLLAGVGWNRAQTHNPIIREHLLSADGKPIPGVLVIPTRYSYYQNPGVDPNFSLAEQGAILDYVLAGGSLLHLTNHSFFSVYDAQLAANFGVQLSDVALDVPNATIPSSGLNYENPVLAGSQNVQSICAHDACLMTTAPEGPYAVTPLATFTPPGEGSQPQLFALTMTPGEGRVVYVANSGWICDYGTPNPAWGLMPYGNNLGFILSILGWLLHCDPPMESVSYKPPSP